MKKTRAALATIIIGASTLSLSACFNNGNSAVNSDQRNNTAQLGLYEKNQPAPSSDFSEYRQTLIEIEKAEIHGTSTTTFFFNMGDTTPIKSCASSGYPIATTSQLTNPQRVYGLGNNNGVTIGQSEPNGVYTGDSTGTYVNCILPNGTKEITYWEGYVETEGGPAHWDNAKHDIVMDGPATVKVNGKTATASSNDAARAKTTKR